MRYPLLCLLLVIASAAYAEYRTIRFTDRYGIEREFEIAANDIGTWRPDGSREITIGYEDGALNYVHTLRPDGSTEADIFYADGALEEVGTHRPDRSAEAVIFYADGALRGVGTYRPDERIEARIEYEDGALREVETYPVGSGNAKIVFAADGKIDTMQLANPFNPDRAAIGIYDISSGSPVCR